jgi:hypothetical protein
MNVADVDSSVAEYALARSGGDIRGAGDLVMREKEEALNREKAREVQRELDEDDDCVTKPVQAENSSTTTATSTDGPLAAEAGGAPPGPPGQRLTSTKSNYPSSGSSSTVGGGQPSVTQTMTQSQGGQISNKGPSAVSASGKQATKGKSKKPNGRGGQG